jgi:PAS domain S-box-containing protein
MSRSMGKGRSGYVWAVMAVAIATGLRWVLLPYAKDSHVFLYYILAVAFSVWAGGSMAGLLAVALGGIVAGIELAPGFSSNSIGDLVGLLLFLLSSLAIIALLQAQQHSAEQRMMAELAEQASRTRRAELEKKDRVALDNTWDVAIIVTDHNRIIREWNVGAAQMTGWSRGETIGQSTDILFPQEDLDKEEPKRHTRAAEAMGKAKIARWLKCRDGSQFYAEGMIRPVVDTAGWVSGFIEVFIDGSARVKAQEEMERRMLDRAEELESLSYSMAHDMRQYTRGMAVNAAMVARDLKDKLSEDQLQAVERLESNGKRMHAMVEGILDHLRVSRADLNSKPVDLSKLGEEVADRIQPAQSGSNVHFIVQPGMWVKGDADLISLVIANLFENAFKYAAGHVRFGYDAKLLAYYVRDEGPGFNPEYAEKIFKPFVRLHGQDTPGTGIGLPNAQRIVERHGGRMWAESDGEGKGATFYFTLKGIEEAPVGVLR